MVRARYRLEGFMNISSSSPPPKTKSLQARVSQTGVLLLEYK